MTAKRLKDDGASRGVMSRLARDVRGNTLAMLAIFLLPLAGFVGSGVDIARLYVVKVRLQQACDAGVLAGRKFMTDDGNATLDATASTQASTFFANNFRGGVGAQRGWLSVHDTVFTPSKTSDNQVHGDAQATVPMAIMGMFGIGDTTLNVSCEARFDVADADIMFVLDTTGSMADKPNGTGGGSVQTYTRPDGTTGYYVQEASGSKISGLRTAVLNFYDTLKNNADPTTHIRYGFVTYTSTVNAGYAVTSVDPGYMVNKWSYNTRRITGDYVQKTNSSKTVAAADSSACASNYSRNPATYSATDPNGNSYTVYPFDQNGTASAVDPSWSNSKGGTCTLSYDTITPKWTYSVYPYDTSQFITGATVDDPSKITGATSRWQGCLEERDTTASSSFDINNLPPDLDPDLVPSSDGTRWRPMWPDVVYYRKSAANTYQGNSSNPYGDYTGTSQGGTYTALGIYNNIAYGYVSCGKPVQRLATLTRDQVSAYVNAPDFVPQGGTYHDTGMIWGTRMISPNGIFASDTAPWPGRNPPNRYIVFMTDGDMAPNASIYGMYGMEQYDGRVTGGTTSRDTDYHNARFVAECNAAKARNIEVFVIGFGQTLTTQLTQCASPGQAYYASDNDALNTAFQNIAKQVAMLRVSK